MPFDSDFAWQRTLIPDIKRVCADYLIGEAPEEEDRERNTDLIVLLLKPVRVACRLRSFGYLQRYPNDFTIRSRRYSGARTELQKVLTGWGDYIFYGFATSDKTKLAAWLLGDLSVFRLWHHQELAARRTPGTEQPNPDGGSFFRAYDISELPGSFIVHRQLYRCEEVA